MSYIDGKIVIDSFAVVVDPRRASNADKETFTKKVNKHIQNGKEITGIIYDNETLTISFKGDMND